MDRAEVPASVVDILYANASDRRSRLDILGHLDKYRRVRGGSNQAFSTLLDSCLGSYHRLFHEQPALQLLQWIRWS